MSRAHKVRVDQMVPRAAVVWMALLVSKVHKVYKVKPVA